MSYFTAVAADTYQATPLTAGAWNPEEQHVSPVLGLMVHAAERHAESEGGPAHPVRMSFDILGTIPIGPVSLEARSLRRGRTVQLAEVVLHSEGRAAVRLRIWFMAQFDTAEIDGHHHLPLDPPDSMEAWDGASVWPGAYIESLQGRRTRSAPGRAQVWLSTPHDLVEGEPVSDFAQFCALLDTANGVAVRARPTEVAFPNLDLTASFFRRPEGRRVGLDTSVSFGPTGFGLTQSVIHDLHGPVGAMTQSLTVRPSAERN